MERLTVRQRETLADHAWRTHLVETELERVLNETEELNQAVDAGSKHLFATKVFLTSSEFLIFLIQ